MQYLHVILETSRQASDELLLNVVLDGQVDKKSLDSQNRGHGDEVDAQANWVHLVASLVALRGVLVSIAGEAQLQGLSGSFDRSNALVVSTPTENQHSCSRDPCVQEDESSFLESPQGHLHCRFFCTACFFRGNQITVQGSAVVQRVNNLWARDRCTLEFTGRNFITCTEGSTNSVCTEGLVTAALHRGRAVSDSGDTYLSARCHRRAIEGRIDVVTKVRLDGRW